MSIFKTKNKPETTEEGTRFVGLQLDRQISSYLSLYCIANEVTKSNIVREALEVWYRIALQPFPESTLLEWIVKSAGEQWVLMKNENPRYVFTVFKDQLIRELGYKGIEVEAVNQIIDELDKQYGAN